jgi:hypothetical protein
MAVAVVMDFDGASLDQYDQVLVKMGLSPGGAGPPGAIFHWVTSTGDGMRVTDVWETREQYDKFAAEQIGPYAAEVGITGPPQIAFHEVHSYMTAG